MPPPSGGPAGRSAQQRSPPGFGRSLFGCPAAFVGRRMAFCVHGRGIGGKLPQADAARLIASGGATAFRPFGRPAMKDRVELRAEPGGALRIAPILALAVR